ncbi:MAG: hypothetical protein ACR9NN_14100 [Nostochopsis sp.]
MTVSCEPSPTTQMLELKASPPFSEVVSQKMKRGEKAEILEA